MLFILGWAAVVFTLSVVIKPLLPEGAGFVCKGLSCIHLFLFSPFSHIHIRVEAIAQQLLKHLFGASMKNFPGHPHSFVCYGSSRLCGPCGNCPGRTQPTLLKWPSPCMMSKIFSKNILLHQVFWKRTWWCFWFLLRYTIFTFFVHFTFHMSTCATRSLQQFLHTGTVAEHLKLLRFWIIHLP